MYLEILKSHTSPFFFPDIFQNFCTQLNFGLVGDLVALTRLSRDSLNCNELDVSRCETLDSNRLLSLRKNVSRCPKIFLLVFQFSKKTYIYFLILCQVVKLTTETHLFHKQQYSCFFKNMLHLNEFLTHMCVCSIHLKIYLKVFAT